MKLYFTFTKKALACFLCLAFLALLFVSKYETLAVGNKNGETCQNRILFLEKIGCKADENSQSRKTVTIPYEFNDVYENYNKLQQKAGYDLSLYKGCKCDIYSYSVKEFMYEKDATYFNANLIVYNGRIIGGDISSAELDGNMYPLCKKNEKAKT